MNSADEAGAADHAGAEVVVALTGGAKEDAHAVFGALRTAYPCDRAPDDLPQDVPGVRSTVWIATFDSTELRHDPATTRLTAPVEATLQGGYTAVEHVRKTLASAFTVRVVGKASGDQEEEIQVRLENR
ncbi:hypothetical protein ACIQVO_03115 [Streptomyces sp. NPDC101062]|uniref:hypothetical protein n=1 Tax=unclassified Streptomyces TaxID=2593676 RepID=UPI002E75A4B3|nr:hypothetical protein [Streptomyces sp. JV176]MEE1802094.1 hypothetical protein [Streptomyces sp. JV176]